MSFLHEYWWLTLLLVPAVWFSFLRRAQRIKEPRLTDVHSRARRYIAQTADFDKLWAPACFTLALIGLTKELYRHSQPLAAPDPLSMLAHGLWLGLGLAALIRYIQARRITTMMLEEDARSQREGETP